MNSENNLPCSKFQFPKCNTSTEEFAPALHQLSYYCRRLSVNSKYENIFVRKLLLFILVRI